MNTTEIGNRTEGVILGALLRAGKNVLVPFGGGFRYDIVFDEGGLFQRVQCKTAVYRKGCVIFNASSAQRDTKVRSHYREAADYFGVFCPELDKTYLVPVGDVCKTIAYLRIDATKNNQTSKIIWAQKYEV